MYAWHDWVSCSVISLMRSSHRRLGPGQHNTVFCLVLSVCAVWIELATSQDCRRQKISKLLSSLEMRRKLLKTVLTSRPFCSHHRQDKTDKKLQLAWCNTVLKLGNPSSNDTSVTLQSLVPASYIVIMCKVTVCFSVFIYFFLFIVFALVLACCH